MQMLRRTPRAVALTGFWRSILRICATIAIGADIFLICGPAAAGEPHAVPDPAPPPIRLMTETVKSGDINSAAVTPDGKLLVTGDNVGRIAIRSVETGRLVRLIEDNGSSFEHIHVSGDGRRILTWDDGHHALLTFDLATGAKLSSVGDQELTWVKGVAVSPDERMAAVGAYETIVIFDLASGTVKTKIEDSGDNGQQLAFSPGGRLLAGADDDEAPIMLWDAGSGRVVRKLPQKVAVAGLQFASEEQLLVISKLNDAMTLQTVGVADGKTLRTIATDKQGFRNWLLDA